jgi:phosphosulfolactate phosphohydrolase-like enzyme
VTLVAAGASKGEPAGEDDYAVAVLASELVGLGVEAHLQPPSGPVERAFHQGLHGQRLTSLGYGDDVDLCASLNIFNVVGVLTDEGFVSMGAEV